MQAVMGTLVKRFLGQQMGLEPGAMYHCAVMPCYDKKLEGSREDFCIPGMLFMHGRICLPRPWQYMICAT
jgi:hypothetical protein